MTQAFFALTVSALAGFATVGGAFFALAVRPKAKMISFFLGFAAGVMLSVSLSELFWEGCSVVLNETPGIWGALVSLFACTVGLLIACMLDVLLASAEKGNSSLFRLGIFSMVAIIVHNLPEGMAVFLTSVSDSALGSSMAAAIALHNFPEGIAIAVPVAAAGKKPLHALAMATVAAAAEPLGALLAWWFVGPWITPLRLGLCYLIIAGLMLYIAVSELLPASFDAGSKPMGVFGCFFGILLMLWGIIIF